MRTLTLAVLLAGITASSLAGPPPATRMVSVAELEQELAVPGARHLLNLKLTQRLSAARLAALETSLQNKETREELEILADESAFLDLPIGEAPSTPTPAPAEQDRLLALASAYARNKMTRWPGFIATRTLTRFEGTSMVIANGLQDDLWSPYGLARLRSPVAQNWECPGEPRLGRRRLEPIEKAALPVLYRDGRSVHVIDSAGEFACSHGSLNNVDEFVEFAALAPLAANSSQAHWSHWEQSAAGVVAVFSYQLKVRYEAARGLSGSPLTIAIHGELAIDPADGGIVRFTELRRWQDGAFMKEYDSALEFGQVSIGGVTVLGPVRRISMYLAPLMAPRTTSSMAESTYRRFQLTDSPLQEYLNDIRFGGFRPYNPAEPQPALTARSDPASVAPVSGR